MIGILMYFSIIQYFLYALTFIVYMFKGVVYNNYFGLIPVVGIKNVFLWFMLAFKYECSDKDSKHKEMKDLEEDIFFMTKKKLHIITNKLIINMEQYKYSGYNRYENFDDWSFDKLLNRYSHFKDYATNTTLYEKFNDCIKSILSHSSPKVIELFSNMIDTVYEIINVDNEITISEEVINGISELCDNYSEVIRQVIVKEKTEKENEIKRKTEKYNRYVQGKIKSINSILKDVEKDLKVV